MRVKIENPTNACISIESEQGKILIDPWLEDGIYDETWHNFPRVSDAQKKRLLQDVSLCLITHLHKDHFNIATLKKLPRDTKIIFVKTFGWQVIKFSLLAEGFSNLTLLDVNESLDNELGFKISAVQPINTSGLYTQADANSMSIDAGYVIESNTSKLKLIFLGDNNIYNTELVKQNLHLLKEPDLIAFAYSGFASDYPFNYNYTDKEKIDICNELEESRFNQQSKNLKLIKPKMVLPYSSEFVAVGEAASDWTNIFKQIYTNNKEDVGRKYANALGCDFETLYPEEFLVYEGRDKLASNKSYDRSNLLQDMIAYQGSIALKTNTEKVEISDSLLEISAQNCFDGVKKNSLDPDLSINIFSDDRFLATLDFKKNKLIKESPAEGSYLNIYIQSEMLNRILKRDFHWDDACLSLKMKWERCPNIFDMDTHNALTYFTAPIHR